MENFLSRAVDIVWGPQLVIFLFGGGLYLLFASKFKAFNCFPLGVRLLLGLEHSSKSGKKVEGQISHFSALTNALAATVGLGNIAGVAVAITQGGPGALVWMWLSGLVGMNTKFFESTLSILFREKDVYGEIQGGPMYYIPQIIKGRLGKFLALFFALAGFLGTQAMFQTNQLANYLKLEAGVSPYLTGLLVALFAAVVISGGLKRVAGFTSAVVPLMCFLYFFSGLVIIAMNYSKVPSVFYLIFSEAFSLKSVGGGMLGYGFVHAFKIGIKRGVFSNEAGAGTAAMAHGNAKTSEAYHEGAVAMIGPFIDTIVVCTITALIILTSIDIQNYDFQNVEGIKLTALAFRQSLGSLGTLLLGFSVFFFSLSTVIGMSNYNEKCWTFVFRGRRFLGKTSFVIFFSTALFFGAIINIEYTVNIIDLGFGLMAYPNIAVLLLASPLIIKELKKVKKRKS